MWLTLTGCAALDGQAPTLEVRAPEGPVREVTLDVRADDLRPGLGRVQVSVGGVTSEATPGAVALDLADGVHTLLVTATDRSLRRNTATVEVTVEVDRTPPALSPMVGEAAQGKTFAVTLRADEPLAEASATFAGRTLALYPSAPGTWRALIGVAIRAEVADAPLALTATDLAGNVATAALTVPVSETPFAVGGHIRLNPKQVAARADEEGRARARAERDAAYAYDQPEQRWNGVFVLPVAGRVSSPFGKYRAYSTGERNHHTGLDLAARRGAPVVAAADGRVLVAGEQVIFGNVVIVHHGQGVSTSYNHLDSIAVEIGSEVRAGELLGTVGSTGQSTGPHLHWGLVVGGEAVDPAQWLETDFGP